MTEITLKYAVSAPYLLHEVLAIAALHLSTLRPDQHTFYQQQAAGLQNTALALMKDAIDSQKQNPVAMFLFASFLGMHVLGDTVLFRDNNSTNFLDSFVGYMKLHRGVSSVINGSWDVIKESELKSLLVASEGMLKRGTTSNNECSGLQSLLDSPDLARSAIDACANTIELLQILFDIDGSMGSINSSTNLIFSWPIRISTVYTDLLMRKKPEAMVILAHYAVLLHRHRWTWLIGQAGRYLVDSIAQHLGARWEPFLEWPVSQLQKMDKVTT